MDLATVDHLLCSTRSVRKRLDFKRPVPADLVTRCIEIALQAPTGSNAQGWHFLVVTDPTLRRGLADLYRKAFELYLNTPGIRPTYEESDPRQQQMPRVVDSASYLAQHLHEAPVHVIPCIEGRTDVGATPVAMQAAIWGSLLPAVWSFMLAARARGLGTCLTSLHLIYEQQSRELLGLPDHVMQGALIPVAHTIGTDFRPGPRRDLDRIIHADGW